MFRYRPTQPLDARPAIDTFSYEVSDGVSRAVGQVSIALTAPFQAPKKPKPAGPKPPNVPATHVGAAGTRWPIPANSVIFISNNTVWGDHTALWWQSPSFSGVVRHTGIGNWTQLVGILTPMPNGSVSAIFISGHGGAGGVATKDDNSWLIASNLTPAQAATIRAKLQPGGYVVLLACAQASGDKVQTTGGEANYTYAEATRELARKLNVPVIANVDEVNSGNYGKGAWYRFDP